MQSLGGGTGSGLGNLLLTKLREEYCSKVVQTFAVMPAWRDESVAEVEAYNATLAMMCQIEFANLSVLYDNEALFGVCKDQLNLS